MILTCGDFPSAPVCCGSCHTDAEDYAMDLAVVLPPLKPGYLTPKVRRPELVAEVCCVVAGYLRTLTRRDDWAAAVRRKRRGGV